MKRNVLRTFCACAIAGGGVLHAAGLYMAEKAGFRGPWWMYAIFGFAVVFYPASAAGILLKRRSALIVAALCPAVGGVLIFLGLMSSSLDYEILIPGTFANEITPVGFLTLVIEPMASLSAILLIFWGGR